MNVGKANKNTPFSKHNDLLHLYGYAGSLEPEVTDEATRFLVGPTGMKKGQHEWMPPQLTLTLVDQAVRYIERNYDKSATYWGAKFAKECDPDDIPWGKSEPQMVFAKNTIAFTIYAALRKFYYLLLMPEYRISQYCVSIEAARQALLFVYPNGFHELPSAEYPLPEGVFGLEARKEFTKLVWPAAERFNSLVDKIAEIVSGSGYRSKVAREKTKLKQRATSVTDLIHGLLQHHQSLTVVAVRLSIRQSHRQDFIGEKMQKALSRLIGDRRNDELLNEAIGYFWVLQESFKAASRQHTQAVQIQNLDGVNTLHYDLVMFFDARRCTEADAIAKHIGACWKVIVGEAGFYRALSGQNFRPYQKNGDDWRMEKLGSFPWELEFVGLVQQGSIEARNLQAAATSMVFSAALRKPSKQSPTLVKSTTRRFGKSDLLTGCGFDKASRWKPLGRFDVKRERKKRPKYVAP